MAINPLWLVGGVGGVLVTSALALLWPSETPPPPPPPAPAPALSDFLPPPVEVPAPAVQPGRLVIEPAALDVRLSALAPERRRLVARNDGGAVIGVTAVEVTGSATAAIAGHTCASLEPSASCVVEVDVVPQGDGRSDAVILVITSSGEPVRVPVQVDVRLPTAAAPPPPPPPDQDALLVAELRRQALEGRRPASLAHGGDSRQIAAGAHSVARLPAAGGSGPSSWRSAVDDGPRDLSLVVPAGAFIPLVLTHAVNTELDSRLVAQVSRPVYGAVGRTVVLPAGTRLLGEVTVQRGEDGGAAATSGTRVAVRGLRLLAPDGRSWTLEGEAVADAMGRTGMVGQVDTRRSDKFWLAGLVSVLGNGAQVAAAAAAGGGTTISEIGNRTVVQQDVLGQALGNAGANFATDMSRITETLLQERERERDVVQVAAGSRLHLVPMVDLVLSQPAEEDPMVAIVGGRPMAVTQADQPPAAGPGAGQQSPPPSASGQTFLDRGYMTTEDIGASSAAAPPTSTVPPTVQRAPPAATPAAGAPSPSSLRQVSPPGFAGGPGDLRPQE